MSARILEGVKVNEGEKTGAVFYDSSTGRAYGPVFEDSEEAERFLTFLAGIDPGDLDWGPPRCPDRLCDSGSLLHSKWLEDGKPEHRKPFQFDADWLNEPQLHKECLDCDALIDDHREGRAHCDFGGEWHDGKCDCDPETWDFQCDFPETCFPLFLGYDNNDVGDLLKKHGVLDAPDTESGCCYAHFGTKEEGLAFLERLNGFLRDNWHRAYSK